MKPISLIIIAFVWSLCACKAQTMEDQIKKIKATSDKIIVAIEKGDEERFKALIGVELSSIAKDQEMLHADFKRICYYYKKYVKSEKPRVVVTEEFTEVGNLKVVIPFYKGCDSTENIKLVQLVLFFGPPDFVPLSGISGYNVVIERCTIPAIIAPPVRSSLQLRVEKPGYVLCRRGL